MTVSTPDTRRALAALCALAGVAFAVALVLVLGAGAAAASESACPSSNAPNELVLGGGSGQTTQLGSAFQTNLQVQLANSNGCPLTGNLAGTEIDFVAPSAGASGIFASSGSVAATVGADAQGVAVAPPFTANDTAGSYNIQAESAYGTVELYLTNTAAGLPVSIVATGTGVRKAAVDHRYAQPLQARVTDANGNPVQGASVSFSIGSSSGGASAGFVGGTAQAEELTDANGEATSPPLVANETAGTFTATAAATGSSQPISFTLKNVAGAPRAIAVGAASGQSARVRRRFRIRLAVTVTDAYGNPVAGTTVTFRAPTHGPGGHFAIHSGTGHTRNSRTVRVTTNGKGIAVAPPFSANSKAGGYIVTTTAGSRARRAAFALVNRPRR
jgi:protocatechuate 3,4-dioxygenase beta subunit